MVSSSTTFKFFYKISRLFSTLTTMSSNMSMTALQCAHVCVEDARCGGITWSAEQVPGCGLVVDPSVAGSRESQSSYRVYRMETYQEKFMFRELPQPWSSWLETHDTCKAQQLDMVPVPLTLRDLATLSIRRVEWLNLDLRRQADGSYMDSHGTVLADTSVLNWGGNNPTYGNEVCIGVGYYPLRFYDQLCTHSTNYYVLCVEKI